VVLRTLCCYIPVNETWNSWCRNLGFRWKITRMGPQYSTFSSEWNYLGFCTNILTCTMVEYIFLFSNSKTHGWLLFVHFPPTKKLKNSWLIAVYVLIGIVYASTSTSTSTSTIQSQEHSTALLVLVLRTTLLHTCIWKSIFIVYYQYYWW
jgi:hypothetical protein